MLWPARLDRHHCCWPLQAICAINTTHDHSLSPIHLYRHVSTGGPIDDNGRPPQLIHTIDTIQNSARLPIVDAPAGRPIDDHGRRHLHRPVLRQPGAGGAGSRQHHLCVRLLRLPIAADRDHRAGQRVVAGVKGDQRAAVASADCNCRVCFKLHASVCGTLVETALHV